MISFKSDDFNIEDMLNELKEFEIDCPIWGKALALSISDAGSIITCPHCKNDIEIKSE